jgi:hypothetical protein
MALTVNRRLRITVLLTALVSLVIYKTLWADGGFDTSNAIIPVEAIESGGPPRDGIPSIDDPVFITPDEAGFLQDDDRVLGIALSGSARAYPIRILNWHEIVNDRIEDQSIVVSFCPLCGTGMVFSAEVDGTVLEFGVSGLLYNSDMLLYDRATYSLWSQIMSQAVAGKLVGTRLTSLPVTHTSWFAWRDQHPETMVLSTDTGYRRDYNHQPYGGYETSRSVMFKPENWPPPDYHPKEWVAGIEIDGQYRAYPFTELERNGADSFNDVFNDKQIVVSWDADNRSVAVTGPDGNPLPVVQGFWFAWYAFHPDTSLFKAL